MKRIHVVSCFLKHGDKILILKRSPSVGSYPGRWAAVSGYIEGEERPLERAYQEILEEVGLEKEKLTLLASGEPLPIDGEPWIVHPFLFEVSDGTIKLDWEHVDYKWINPEDISKYETVPKLNEALKRVLGNERRFEH